MEVIHEGIFSYVFILTLGHVNFAFALSVERDSGNTVSGETMDSFRKPVLHVLLGSLAYSQNGHYYEN